MNNWTLPLDQVITIKHAKLFPEMLFTCPITTVELMVQEIYNLRMERGEVATQTVGISGASAAMQASGTPRRGQYLPDATSLGVISESQTAELSFYLAGEWETRFNAILGTEIERCRAEQDAKHGGAEHDDTHTSYDWFKFIRKFLERAELAAQSGRYKSRHGEGYISAYRDPRTNYEGNLIHVIGLCIAAIQSSRRKHETANS